MPCVSPPQPPPSGCADTIGPCALPNVPRAYARGRKSVSLRAMKTPIALLAALLSLTLLARAEAADDAARAAFREIYREMVEIDSSPSTGSCTKVVRAAETRLKAEIGRAHV